MKQIIPFKKDIIFKTNISDVTTISLEHDLELRNSDLISGSFSLSGKYKMTENSSLEEDFAYELPFDIAIDSRFDTSNVSVDIDDFNYEIINNEVLRVSIDVSLDNLVSIDDEVPTVFDVSGINEPRQEVEIIEEEVKEELNEEVRENKEATYANQDIKIEVSKEEQEQVEKQMDTIMGYAKEKEETYSTYHICIVRENDTLESIVEKYGTNKEELKKYNESLDIQIGDKLIIPASNE